MKIQFLGAAGTVTGSCAMIEANGVRFCVDCGLHQGNAAIEARNSEIGLYKPGGIDFMLLTHAHMDHAGLLPAMAASGFRKNVFCTRPTADLLGIMLEDSARIQETEAEYAAKKYRRLGRRNPPPALYTREDAQKACELIKSADYHRTFEPARGIKATYYDAGHILGSGTLRLDINDHGKSASLIFSGDIGRPQALIVRDPEIPPAADYVFMESTYGDRDHKNEGQSEKELAQAIAWSHSHGEKTIIPAFAVERTQEVLYCLYNLSRNGGLPEDMAIFVDSPLAIKATEIFGRHQDFFDARARALLADGGAAGFMERLRYTPKPSQSQEINSFPGPAIVISASGMCNAGRVRHHLKHNIWRAGAAIVFVGYQAQGTPGRKLVDKAKKINMFGEELDVAAQIFTINGFSAHAGQSQLLAWLRPIVQRAPKKPRVTLLHGENSAQKILAGLIERDFGIQAHIPGYLDEMRIDGEALSATSGNAAAQPPVNWPFLSGEVDRKWRLLKERVAALEAMPWPEQTELEEEFVALDQTLGRLLGRSEAEHD